MPKQKLGTGNKRAVLQRPGTSYTSPNAIKSIAGQRVIINNGDQMEFLTQFFDPVMEGTSREPRALWNANPYSKNLI
jgi:ABC-type Zn uptake system ZnuABC Zn-binding protein ZnuA